MNTVVLELRSLRQTLSEVAHAMKLGRGDREARIAFATPGTAMASSDRQAVGASPGHVRGRCDVDTRGSPQGGKVEFPFDAVKVEFLLQAA